MFIRIVFAVLALQLSSYSLTAQAQTTTHEWVIDVLDGKRNLGDIGPRTPTLAQVVSELEIILQGDATTVEKLNIAKLLCGFGSWNAGSDSSVEDSLQDIFWQAMSVEDGPNTEGTRYFDCAAAYRLAWYRDVAIIPMREFRNDLCNGELNLGTVQERISAINNLNRNITDGINAAAGGQSPNLSYYPMRNMNRLASYMASQAVGLARDGNWNDAKGKFIEIAAMIADIRLESGYLAARNGWRFHNDLLFYEQFYRWLGEGDGPLDISVFQNWPTLIDEQLSVQNAFRAELGNNVEKDYVDPIYLERLLPGAQNSVVECAAWSNWHGRTYYIQDFANFVADMSCVKTPPKTFGDLANIDSCMLKYEATDWTLTFVSYQNTSATNPTVLSGLEIIEAYVDALVERLPEGSTAVDVLEQGLETRDVGNVTRIVAAGLFSTSQRSEIGAVVDDLLSRKPRGVPVIDPLFSRPNFH